MAAVPFKATLVFARGSAASPNRFSYFCTVSDVVDAEYVFQDGSDNVTLPNISCWLVDIILSPTYGTDTTVADLYANGKATGDVVVNSANQDSTYQRQFQGAPIGFKPSANIKFTQIA